MESDDEDNNKNFEKRIAGFIFHYLPSSSLLIGIVKVRPKKKEGVCIYTEKMRWWQRATGDINLDS